MRKFLKIAGYTLGGIILMILLLVVLLQTPAGKEFVRKQAQKFLQEKLKTPVVIGGVDYSLPKSLDLQGVVFIDKNKDTLLRLNELSVDMKMLELVRGKVNVNKLSIVGLDARIKRNVPDTTFNYQYIIDAFANGTDTTKNEMPSDTSAAGIVLNIKRIDLKDIHFAFEDEMGGVFFDTRLRKLVLRPKSIELNKMAFDLKELKVDGLRSTFATDTSYIAKEADTSTTATPFNLTLDKLDLSDVGFAFDDKVDSLHFDILLGSLTGKLRSFDLTKEEIVVDNLSLDNANTRLIIGKEVQRKNANPAPEANDSQSNWKIFADNLMLKKVNFLMDNNNMPHTAEGMDYAHLDIQNFSVNLENVFYATDTISGNLKHLALNERSGLNVEEMRSHFTYTDKGATLKDFYLQTPNTILQDHLEVSYPSLEAVQKDPSVAQLNIGLSNSHLAVNDLLIFTPKSVHDMLKAHAGKDLRLAGAITGYLNNLKLNQLNVAGLNNTEVLLSGTIKGLPDANKMTYDLQLGKVYSTYNDIAAFVPKSVQQQISIPKWFSISGNIVVNINDFHPNLKISSSDGDATIAGYVLMAAGKNKEKYDLDLTTNNLNVGKILRQDSLFSTISMYGKLIGQGFDINYMNAKVDGNVQAFYFKGYNYRNVQLNSTISNKIVDLHINAHDPNANLLVRSQINLSKDNDPTIKADIDIAYLNPFALSFITDTLALKGLVHLDFTSINPRFPSGIFEWTKPQIILAGQKYNLDTVYFKSTPTADSSQHIIFDFSKILVGSLSGHIPLTEAGQAALSHINKYFKISDTLPPVPDYDLYVEAGIYNHPLLNQIVPELNNFNRMEILGSITPTQFLFNAYSPSVGYGSQLIQQLNFNVEEADNLMTYNIAANNIAMGESMKLWKPTVSGYLAGDTLLANVSVSDSALEEQFALGAIAYLPNSLLKIRMQPNLKLNYNEWNVAPNNELVFGSQGFYINNLLLQRSSQSISIKSKDSSTFGSPLMYNIQNFGLDNITAMLSSSDTLVADGTLNAQGTIDLSDTFPKITSNLTVDSFAVLGSSLGRLTAQVKNENANTYNSNIDLNGFGNSLTLNGKYHLEPVAGNNLDFLLNINPINLKSFESLSGNSIRNSSGGLSGMLAIKGTIEKPWILGSLNTDSFKTTISSFNTPIFMNNQTINFNKEGIFFNQFTLLDPNNQKAILNGEIETKDYRDFHLNLSLKTDSFLAMNSTKKDNESLYGRLLLSSNLLLTGEATAPSISGLLRIHDSTKAYFAMVDEGHEMQDNDGIVIFSNPNDSAVNKKQETIVESHIAKSGIDMNVNIDIDKAANFNVIIDPETGDNLSVSGEAFLNTELQQDGTIGLAGTYALESGYYELNYSFFKRKFNVQKGSTITLAGDPLEAEANIIAAYDANVSPYELVQQQVTDPAQLVFYKQRLPFQIVLKITGKVMNPSIIFDIVLPEEKANLVSSEVSSVVSAKLNSMRNSPSDMNKQAFAILTLGRFITDDPFSNMGSSAEYLVRQTAARFLSQQLNSIAESLIHGLDLSVGLVSEEDYSTGNRVNRSDLNITASKALFNDRLKITIGNDFQLEGQASQQRQTSFLPGTISVDYSLTPDNLYSLRAYRNSQLQNILNGYVTETGLSFRMSRNFNRFQDFFLSRKKIKEIRKKQREKEEKKEASEKQSKIDTKLSGVYPVIFSKEK